LGVPPQQRSVILELTDERGERIGTYPLTGSGGTIRVGVGRPGRRSGVWRIWANRGKSDVYIAARSIAGIQKFSLHGSGDWRHQWVTPNQAEEFTANRDRVMDRWPRPPEGPGGWTKALSIWVPKEDVQEIEDDNQVREGVTWTPEPPDGFAVGIHVVVAETDRGFVRVSGVRPLDGFSLASGEVALVLMGLSELDEQQRQRLDEFRARALAMVSRERLASAKAPRVSLFGYDDQGNRIVWDLAAKP
jgi:hypothetical protein